MSSTKLRVLLGFALFFLIQLRLLLALPLLEDQNDQLNQEKDGHGTIVPKELTVSIRLGDNHRDQIKAVIRRGGGAHGGGGDVAGNNGGGDGKSANGQGAAVIPVYAAGATNNNRYHHHGSSSGTINCIASTCFLFILFTSFMLFVYSM